MVSATEFLKDVAYAKQPSCICKTTILKAWRSDRLRGLALSLNKRWKDEKFTQEKKRRQTERVSTGR